MILWLFTAFAWADPHATLVGNREVRDVIVYSFDLPRCDDFRARVEDPDALHRAPEGAVELVLNNLTDADCTYEALMLAGSLTGSFKPQYRVGETGFRIPAHASARLSLTPEHRAQRPLVVIEAAPRRRSLLVAAPTPPTPAITPQTP